MVVWKVIFPYERAAQPYMVKWSFRGLSCCLRPYSWAYGGHQIKLLFKKKYNGLTCSKEAGIVFTEHGEGIGEWRGWKCSMTQGPEARIQHIHLTATLTVEEALLGQVQSPSRELRVIQLYIWNFHGSIALVTPIMWPMDHVHSNIVTFDQVHAHPYYYKIPDAFTSPESVSSPSPIASLWCSHQLVC